MAYDSCDPCCSQQISFSSNETARYAIGNLLCQILAALEGTGGGTSPFAAVDAHIAFGSVTLGWTTALTVSSNLGILRFQNTTNRDIQISFDAGATYFTVASGTFTFFNLAENGLQVSTNISIRGVTAVPVTGEIEVFGSTVTATSLVNLTPETAHYPFGSITTAFTTALTNAAAIKFLRVNNTTNQPLQISYDAGTHYFTIKAGTIETYSLADNHLTIDGNISVKALVPPISGELEIFAGV